MAAAKKEKPLIIRRVANTALYEVAYEGGGELPDELKGHMYTSPTLAQAAIDNYRG